MKEFLCLTLQEVMEKFHFKISPENIAINYFNHFDTGPLLIIIY